MRKLLIDADSLMSHKNNKIIKVIPEKKRYILGCCLSSLSIFLLIATEYEKLAVISLAFAAASLFESITKGTVKTYLNH